MPIGSTVWRWAFSLITVGIVVASLADFVNKGAPTRAYDVTFFFWLVLLLVPAGTFAMVPRNQVTTVVAGSLLLLVTALSWWIVQVSRNDFRILVPALGWFISLGVVSWALVDPFSRAKS